MRKLMLAALGYVSALCIANYILPLDQLLIAAAVCAVLCIPFLFFKGHLRTGALIFLISAALAFAWFRGHYELRIAPAEELVGKTHYVNCIVKDYPNLSDEYSSVEMELSEDEFPKVRMLVYDYNSGFSELAPGDRVSAELKFLSAAIMSQVETDYYYASGIFLRAYVAGEDYTVIGDSDSHIKYLPQMLAHKLKSLILDIFPEDVAPTMKALLTGDKQEFYDDTELYAAMKVSGFMHIVAVSGMHVSFLISLLSLFTGRRRITCFIGVPMVWLFAAMTGLGPSVVRSALMISLCLAALILRRENDPPTSLSAAALLILCVNPNAVGSISFQLSFAAMAGIILVAPRVYSVINSLFVRVDGIVASLLRSVSGVVSASVGALVFSTPLLALHFGYVPLYSVITNMFCLWAMSSAFMLGFVVCLAGAVFLPVGIALGAVLAWLPRYAIFAVKFIASWPYAALITRSTIMGWWLIYAYFVLGLPYLLRGKRPYRPIIPVCCCVIGLVASLFFNALGGGNATRLSAVDVGQGQCIVASTNNATVVIDCGGRGFLDPGDAAAEFLLKDGRDSVDLLILTHLHADHANGVTRLMSYVDVERIAIPVDCEDTEYRDSILQMCYAEGTEVFLIEADTQMQVDSLELALIAPLGSSDPNEKGLIVLGSKGEFSFLVTGDADEDTERLLASIYELDAVDILVAGHHGSKYSTGDALLDAATPSAAFISVGVNSYGHPTVDVLERLESRGIRVLRTDIDGNITYTVDDDHG